jgi:hypothetical protein
LDELASLQRLPQLHTAITENRKSQNPLVLGFQGKAQLEVIYGHLAEVMLSQPATKIFLKTTEPKAAEWVSNAIGKIEIERMKETHFDGTRSGKNFTLDRQVEPLVMDSEISGLENRHAFLKLGNNVARFHFDYMDVPQRTRGFIARDMEDDALGFDPITLIPKAQPARESTIDLEAELPKVKAGDSPAVKDAVLPVVDEPTEEELAEAGADTDSPVDAGEAQDEVGVQSTLDFVGR